jgi:hypothetical protein
MMIQNAANPVKVRVAHEGISKRTKVRMILN